MFSRDNRSMYLVLGILFVCLFHTAAIAKNPNELEPVQIIDKNISIKMIGEQSDISIPLNNARHQIIRAWFAPNRTKTDRAATVALVLSVHGQPTSVRLLQSSGVKLFDETALRAITNAAPYLKLPSKKKIVVKFDSTYPL